MTAGKAYTSRQLVVWLALLAVVLFLLGFVRLPERAAFVSSEIAFTDPSASGLAILSASCASNPQNYHGNLAATADGLGYVSATGQNQYGAVRNSVYICISNTTGSSYFIPANTAAEMNAVKAKGPTSWTNCASENGTCNFSGTMVVRYGTSVIPGSPAYAFGIYTTSVACNNATFGDPASGWPKTCDYAPISIPNFVPF